MNDYIFFMHDDVPHENRGAESDWTPYLSRLREAGVFQGGSAIGDGVCESKLKASIVITRAISGYIRVQAENLDAARALLDGNPVYEAGGTVEIRELPRSG